LVDDDPLVCMPLAEALTAEGCQVVSASDATEGLAVLRQDAVDLAIIDVALPGQMNGIALAREVKRLRPDLRIIFMSGKPPGDTALEGLGEFVAKPARISELLDAVAGLLKTTQQSSRGAARHAGVTGAGARRPAT
jgi:DNA-binding response OmpR family regulator